MVNGKNDVFDWAQLYGAKRDEPVYRAANDAETSFMARLAMEREDGWADGSLALQKAKTMAIRWCALSAVFASPVGAAWVLLAPVVAVVVTLLWAVVLAWLLQTFARNFPAIRREHDPGAPDGDRNALLAALRQR
jgi:hypothetical protein